MAALRSIRLRLAAFHTLSTLCIMYTHIGNPWRKRKQCMCKDESAFEIGCTQVCMMVVCMPSGCFCESRVIRAALAV
jgi:hypothetical protein